MRKFNNFRRGGVSMFIVIVTTVLIAIISASFLRLMVRDQERASTQDLSQSAYDSAQAGVEDAKRFMSKYQSKCFGAGSEPSECEKLRRALENSPNSCNALYAEGVGVGAETGETLIQSDGNNELNQAYTCLKIKKDSLDFLGEVDSGESKIIPLRSVADFNKVKISWHTRKDSDSIFLDGNVNNKPNFKSGEWGQRPALMKAQFFGFSSDAHNFEVLNSNFSDDGVGIDERLYYPVRSGLASDSLPKNKRTGDANSTNNTTGVTCRSDLSSVVYSCEVLVDIGTQIKAGSEAYLRLSPIYKKANFKVELYDGGQLVAFDGVQPVVDSTGRANDQFRRVESRIEISNGNLPVADFAVQIDGENKKLCKDFWATNKASGFEKCS
ncbi:MAG: hypothetical protein Q4A21_03175 [bacterium]|nr:hypothetical protein [bacterium]